MSGKCVEATQAYLALWRIATILALWWAVLRLTVAAHLLELSL